jgi:tripeptidyl-peptidase-1
MSLVTGKQNVTLYQTGDMVEGRMRIRENDINILLTSSTGASFNNFLDAIDGSYCTFEGGDDYTQDAQYPDPYGGGYEGRPRLCWMVHIINWDVVIGPEDCGTVTPAYVISTSYGYNEADLTQFYTARQCAEYAKLGLMGVTVLYSSGDDGVAGNGNYCLNPDGMP